MPNRYSWDVKIQGVGTVRVLAETSWEAEERAHTDNMNEQPDRLKYKAKKVRYKRA